MLDTIAEKGDLELIKELNDLREKVMDLKAERNRIIDQLTNNDLINLGDRREKEMSTEAFLNYIQSLIMSKKQLATDLMEREAEINNLVKASLVSEQRIKQFEHDQGEIKGTLKELRQELRNTRETLEEKNLQIIALNEKVSRKEIEFKADLQEHEIKAKHALSDRDKVFNTISGLKSQMKEMQKDFEATLKF